jgi:hypothetical protein
LDKNRQRRQLKQSVRFFVLGDPICLSRVVTLAQVHEAGLSSQPRATSATAATTSTSAALPTAYIPYQPRIGAYPYAVGAWGYHYPSIQTATASSSVPPVAAQGDSATKLVASGTFAYPYAGVQYTPGQPEYVPPQVKYPYGAPALPVPTPSPTSPSAGVTSTSSAMQERQYDERQCYIVGSRDPIPAVETRAQESKSSTDAWESTPNPGEVAPLMTDTDNVTPSAANPVPTSMEITV